MAMDGEELVTDIVRAVASLQSQIKAHNEYVDERLRVIRMMLDIVRRDYDLSPKDAR